MEKYSLKRKAVYKPLRMYASEDEAMLAYNDGVIGLHCPILVRRTLNVEGTDYTRLVEITPGRIIFNQNIPQDPGFVDRMDMAHVCDYEITVTCGKTQLGMIVDKTINKHGFAMAAEVLDSIKSTGFKYATKSGSSIAITDMTIPPQKYKMVTAAEWAVQDFEILYRFGFMTEQERHKRVADAWEQTAGHVFKALQANLDRYNPIFMMADSGACCSMWQLRQLAGMRGLISTITGKTMEAPIKANYREGLTALEYFISSCGARKSQAYFALQAAGSGYFIRRLVDVSQEVIFRHHDCGVTHGIKVSETGWDGQIIKKLSARLRGRFLVSGVVAVDTGEVLLSNEVMMKGEPEAKLLESRKWVQENPGDPCKYDPAEGGKVVVMIRTVLTCKTPSGVCAKCYGMNPTTQRLVDLGEAVGIIAAHSIGELNTWGLFCVEELFEARKPRGMATLSEIGGTIRFEEAATESLLIIVVTAPDGDTRSYAVPRTGLQVKDSEVIEAGRQLTCGALDPHDVFRIRGTDTVCLYLIRKVLQIYCKQGVDISDKHIEIIIRQVMRNVYLEDAGNTGLLDSSIVDVLELDNANDDIARRNGNGERREDGEPLLPAVGTRLLLGITKASLAADSFLSAASFQETTKVLTEAAGKGKKDHLRGLKENVIIGKLILAGTGLQS